VLSKSGLLILHLLGIAKILYNIIISEVKWKKGTAGCLLKDAFNTAFTADAFCLTARCKQDGYSDEICIKIVTFEMRAEILIIEMHTALLMALLEIPIFFTFINAFYAVFIWIVQ